MSKGKIFKEYLVVCGICTNKWRARALNQKEAAHFFRGGGWSETQDAGWICCLCVEDVKAVKQQTRKAKRRKGGRKYRGCRL